MLMIEFILIFSPHQKIIISSQENKHEVFYIRKEWIYEQKIY